jgi:hypothetical protein
VNTSGDLANAGRVLTAQFENMKAEVGSALLPAIQELLPAIGDLVPVIGNVLKSFAPLVTTLIKAVAPILEKIGVLFEGLAEALGPVIESLADALAPILDIIVEVLGDVLEAILPVVVIIVQSLLPVIDILAWVLRSVLGPIITWVADLLSAVLGPVLKVVGDAIGWVAGLFGVATDKVGEFGDAIDSSDPKLARAHGGHSRVARGLNEELIPALEDVGPAAEDMGEAVAVSAVGVEKSLVEVAGEAVKDFVSIFSQASTDTDITANQILTNVQDAVDRQARFTTSIATLTAAGLDSIVSELLTKGPAAVGEAEALAGDLATAFQIESELDAITANNMTALVGAVSKYGDEVNTVFTQLGGEAAIGLANGIVANQGRVTTAMRDTIDLAEKVARLRGKMESPSRLFADRVGLPIAQGIAQGIAGGGPGISSAVSGVIDAATMERLTARIETAVLQARPISLTAVAEGSRDLARTLADDLRFEAL